MDLGVRVRVCVWGLGYGFGVRVMVIARQRRPSFLQHSRARKRWRFAMDKVLVHTHIGTLTAVCTHLHIHTTGL